MFVCSVLFVLFLNVFLKVSCIKYDVPVFFNINYLKTSSYAYWENATVPFYINREHFDDEQALSIMKTLSMFAFKTCVKFNPVMSPPSSNEHIMTFVNPEGIRRCVIDTRGHSVDEPHYVTLGYDCLQSPNIEMMIMRALGFPFEHNRISRDVFIEVITANIEPAYMDLFTKGSSLPAELRAVPYDVNSVMHFGDRDFSKNGHRTIIIKNKGTTQKRNGLTKSDLTKFEIVYGPECQKRDRQEKIDLCQDYPGVARKKRDTNEGHIAGERTKRDTIRKNHKETKEDFGGELRKKKYFGVELEDVETKKEKLRRRKRNTSNEPSQRKSLRVNPNITPPQELANKHSLRELGIENEMQALIDEAYKVADLAMKNARKKYCNTTDNNPIDVEIDNVNNEEWSIDDALAIVETVANYAVSLAGAAAKNLTAFCKESESNKGFLRQRCNFNDGSHRCRPNYRSTKSGAVRYSTQHRPYHVLPTKHEGRGFKHQFDKMFRAGNTTDTDIVEITTEMSRNSTESDRKDFIRNATNPENMAAAPVSRIEDTTEKKVVRKKRDVIQQEQVEAVKVGKAENGMKETQATTTYKKGDVSEMNNREEATGIVEKTDNGKKEIIDEPKPDNESGGPKIVEKLDKTTETQNTRKKRDVTQPQTVESETEIVTPNEETASKWAKIKMAEKPKRTDKEKHLYEKRSNFLQSRLLYIKSIGDSRTGTSRVLETDEHDVFRPRESTSAEDNWDSSRVSLEHTDVKGSREKKVVEQERDEKSREDGVSPQEVMEDDKSSPERLGKKASKYIYSEKKSTMKMPKTVPLSKANLEFYTERMWPNGVVRFVIKAEPTYDIDDLRARLAEVDRILQKKTCVRLKEISEESAENYEDYLVLDSSQDYVTGRVGGKQHFGSIELFQGNQHRQHTAMMVMAMLGFYFEVSRHDRDKYVRVHSRHVRPDKLHHFEKIRHDATLAVPYDFESATHPAWQYWRKIGRTGISTVATYKETDPDGSIMKALGQHDQLLSKIDIIKINSVYGVKCFQKKRTVNRVKKTIDNIADNIEPQIGVSSSQTE